jgi:hypothetical protein
VLLVSEVDAVSEVSVQEEDEFIVEPVVPEEPEFIVEPIVPEEDAEAIAFIIEKFVYFGHTPTSAAAWAESGADMGREMRSDEATAEHDPRAAEDKS